MSFDCSRQKELFSVSYSVVQSSKIYFFYEWPSAPFPSIRLIILLYLVCTTFRLCKSFVEMYNVNLQMQWLLVQENVEGFWKNTHTCKNYSTTCFNLATYKLSGTLSSNIPLLIIKLMR